MLRFRKIIFSVLMRFGMFLKPAFTLNLFQGLYSPQMLPERWNLTKNPIKFIIEPYF